MLPLEEKTVLVTGAGRGIGRSLAIRLAQQGATLLLTGRDVDALSDTQHAIADQGGQAKIVAGDLLQVSSRETLRSICETLPEGLYGLVNNAGCSHFSWLQDQTEDRLQQQIEVNLLSPILLTRALLPALKKTGNARVLNIGSTFGSIGYPGYTAYCASKFGLRGFTEALRRELADTGLHIMYLAPRATATTLNTSNVVEMNKALGNGFDTADLVAETACTMLIDGKPATRFIGNPEGIFARLNQMLPALVDGSLRKQLSTIRHFATREK